MTWLAIAGGGALGALGRFFIGGWAQGRTESDFPVGTLAINVVGCLVFGFLYAWCGPTLSAPMRGLIFTGILGGFTTFSTFGFETVDLLNRNMTGMAVAYVTASIIGGLLAAWLGVITGNALKPA